MNCVWANGLRQTESCWIEMLLAPAHGPVIQADGQQDPGPGVSGLGDVCGASARDEQGRQWKHQRAEDEDSVDRLVAIAHSFPQMEAGHQGAPFHGRRFAHFSGTRMPRRPVGLNTSTPIRMPQMTTSVHFEFM